jgi:hypothetical protein
MHGVLVQENGVFHAHGAIVSVSAETSEVAVGVTGLQVLGSSAFAHTPETAFVVNAGPGGASARLAGTATGAIQSPFLWQQGTEPPRSEPGVGSSPFVTSIRGADLFVETDCTTSGCSNVGTIPRLLIHRPECSGAGGPWWDVRANACR